MKRLTTRGGLVIIMLTLMFTIFSCAGSSHSGRVDYSGNGIGMKPNCKGSAKHHKAKKKQYYHK